MNRIRDHFVNVLGSVGIAALGIAVLLVPNIDLNAATGSTRCYLGGCYGYINIANCAYTGDCNPAAPTCVCSGPSYPVNEGGVWICPAYCNPPSP